MIFLYFVELISLKLKFLKRKWFSGVKLMTQSHMKHGNGLQVVFERRVLNGFISVLHLGWGCCNSVSLVLCFSGIWLQG